MIGLFALQSGQIIAFSDEDLVADFERSKKSGRTRGR
jgi:hypothetical protein